MLVFPNLRLTFPDYRCGIFILWVQFCPPLGIVDSFLLLAVEILIAVGHPHIPLRLVLSFFSDGLQHLNGAKQSLIPFVVGGSLIVIADNGVVFQCPRQRVGNAVVPTVLRDGIQCLDAAGVLVLVVPLLQLCKECLLVLRGVRDIVYTIQRFVQLVILILSFCPIILLL